MFPTGNPSSSRRKEKAPVVPLTREEELEAEIADLRRINDQLQGIVDGQTTETHTLNNEIDSLREALEAKHQDNQRLSGQVDSHSRRIVRLEGAIRNITTIGGLVLHSESGPVPSAAHRKAERMEHAKRQPEQPDSNDRAEELESQKTSNNATEGEFQMVKAKKNPTAQVPGSMASFLAGPLSSPNYFRAIDPEDPLKKQRGSKTQGYPSPRPAEQRYVSPPPDTVKTDAQSRTGSSGPHQPESVKNYAQMATEPTPYILTTKSFSFGKRLAPIFRERARKAAESSKSSENPTLGVDSSSIPRKRSLSQTSSVPDLSQKRPKSSSREFSPPTTPTEAELEALRASLGRNERDGRKSEG